MLWHLRTMLTYRLGHWQNLLTSLFGLAFLLHVQASPVLQGAPGWADLLYAGLICWFMYADILRGHHASSAGIPAGGGSSPHPALPMTPRARALGEALAYVCRILVGAVPLLVLVSLHYGPLDGVRYLSALAFLLPLALCVRLRANTVTTQSQPRLDMLPYVLGEYLGWFGLHRGMMAFMGWGHWASLLASTLVFLAMLAWGRPLLRLPPARLGFKARREVSARTELRVRRGLAGPEALRRDLWRGLHAGALHTASLIPLFASMYWLFAMGTGDALGRGLAFGGLAGALLWFVWFVAGRPLGLPLRAYAQDKPAGPFALLPVSERQLTAVLGLHAAGALLLWLTVVTGVALIDSMLERPSWWITATLLGLAGTWLAPALWSGSVVTLLGTQRERRIVLSFPVGLSAGLLVFLTGLDTRGALQPFSRYSWTLAVLASLYLAVALWPVLKRFRAPKISYAKLLQRGGTQ